MTNQNLGVIDVGTTNVKFFVYNEKLKRLHSEVIKIGLHYPGVARVEQDANLLFNVVNSLVKRAKDYGVKDLGISTYRASIVFWNRKGLPLSNVITWMDGRGKEVVDSFPIYLKILSRVPIMRTILSPNSPAILVKWFLNKKPELYDMLIEERAYVGTVESYLIYRLTGEYSCDPTNASLTGLIHPKSFELISIIFKLLGLPQTWPEVKDTIDYYGEVNGINLNTVIADQQAALIGEGCVKAGEGKVTNGTGSFVDVIIGEKFRMANEGLIPLVVFKVKDKVLYGLEGFIPATGAMIDWFIENGFFRDHEEIIELARNSRNSHGVTILPAFSGLNIPKVSHKMGFIGGLSLSANRGHIARALLESIAFSIFEIVKKIEKSAGFKIKKLYADGGLSKNSQLLEIMANILEIPIIRQRDIEVTAKGVGLLLLMSRDLLGFEDIPKYREIEFKAEPLKKKNLIHSYRIWKTYLSSLRRTYVKNLGRITKENIRE